MSLRQSKAPKMPALSRLGAMVRQAIFDFDHTWSHGDFSYVGGGIESHVFKLQLPSGEAIAIKVPMVRYIENDNDQGLDAFDLLRQEQEITSYLTKHGFPVPTPIAMSLPLTEGGVGFLASQYIDNDGSMPATGALGNLLLQLHDLQPPSFRPVAQRLGTWEETVALLIRTRSEVVEALSGVHTPQITCAQLVNILRSEQQKTALLHMDLRNENILCTRGNVKAVVDWSNCLVAPPELELYRMVEYGLWTDAVQMRYGVSIKSENDGDALSLIYRLYTATMLAVVFLSESPDPVRAKVQVAKVEELYRKLGSILDG